MSALIDSDKSAVYQDGEGLSSMQSGQKIRFQVVDNPRLASGTTEQLNHRELFSFGIHWPELDEDLSLRGLLSNDYGQAAH